jgi:hypothetical protein
LRYYLYISDAKVDMLFSQIDESVLKRISAEVKVDLKVAGVTLRQKEQPIATRTAKLKVVEQYITKYHSVGTTADPGPEYFRGRMDMQWGWLGAYWRDQQPAIVIFRGREDSNFVALAGSRRHVLGEQAGDSARHAEAFSALPSIIELVGEHISESPEIARDMRDLRRDRERGDDSAARGYPPEFALNGFAGIHLVVPPEPLEFLAVRLLESSMSRHGYEGMHGVIGTPLYVARWNRPDLAADVL